ncbi:thioredoxin fold domain-containing protein [Candidatus Venteria ishoeyi]|uniref:Thiol:disulfide interchange protein n=1 Tax=Candidatus Venteria ishoeyi TaxID=1899563 RepID=A0A1H6FF41_9GAMM|nr:thioredoxin fold domain-containing protein [Candidatus Venteria ishoeyi]SEH07969.1 Thiol:disulfide interchange protein DsbC precursor [Candidatus Venteria ishoeyi]
MLLLSRLFFALTGSLLCHCFAVSAAMNEVPSKPAEIADNAAPVRLFVAIDSIPKLARQKLIQEISLSGLGLQNLPALKMLPPETDKLLYQAQVGPYVFDISIDGKFSMHSSRFSNANHMLFADVDYADVIRETLSWLDESRMVVYEPTSSIQHTLTIFTDTTCPFSQNLHQEIPTLNAAGVRVRYLPFPRLGEHSQGLYDMTRIWCSAERQENLDAGFSGFPMDEEDCRSDLEFSITLGNALGLMGTPTILFEGGSASTGYSSAHDLLQYLDEGVLLPTTTFSWIGEQDTPEQMLSEPVEVVTPPVQISQLLKTELKALKLNNFNPEYIRFTKSDTFYLAEVGSYLFQISEDSNYLFQSNLLEKHPELFDSQVQQIRRQMMDMLDESSMIVFEPTLPAGQAGQMQVKHTLSLFVDASCPFCTSQYQEIPYLRNAGVRIRYLAFPKNGLESAEADLLARAWCLQDIEALLLNPEKLKTSPPPSTSCKESVAAHYLLGRSLELFGTPGIVLETGEAISGYVSFDELMEYMETPQVILE